MVGDTFRRFDLAAPGNGYHIFAGKDASRGLGMSSLKPEDAVSDYSTLTEAQMKVLNDWHEFFLCVPPASHLRVC